MTKLPDFVREAIKSGPIPEIRDWQNLPPGELTTGEKVLRFAADHLVFPEGVAAGKPLVLDIFQQAFILAAFDENVHISKAILSMARRGGKTLIMAVILLAFIVGPLARRNTLVRSGAMTRDQAGLLYRFMSLICQMSPNLEGLYRAVDSAKRLHGIMANVEYQALSRDAKSGHGQGMYVLVLDEAGQIDASHDDFLDMLFSSMGTYDDSKVFIISTQAPSDQAFLSLEIDRAERDNPTNTVCHLYTAESDEIDNRDGWYQANPALRAGYRSLRDVEDAAKDALAIPAKQSGFLNLYMNRRVSRQTLWLAARVWKQNAGEPDLDVLRFNGVHLGLDLSQKNDLTAAVASAMDEDGNIHLLTFAFSPAEGIEERSRRDKTPYDQWARDGILIAPPGPTLDYDWIAQYLRDELYELGINTIHTIQFDRWRINEFKSAAERYGFAQEAAWKEVGQGYRDMSPRIEAMETALLQNRIRHGANPVLTLGASSAIIVSDPAGNKKLDKSKVANKIDGIIAMVMSCYPMLANDFQEFDVQAMVG